MSDFYRRLGIRLATFSRRRRCSNSTFRQFRPYFTCNGISSWNHQLPHDRRESHRSLRQDTFHNTKQFSSDTTGDQSRKFTHLETPTVQDARELFILMDSKPGCLLTTFLDENNPNGDSTGSLEKYNVDWTGHYRGFSSIVVRPQSTEEVARILRYCSERRIGVVPQGGNTGLVGGSIPISSQEIVLSLEKMNNIESDDSELTVAGSVLRAEAGCILQDLQDRAAKAKCLVPVDLGAKGTCQIGGNVSTNAGGVYYYRYGSLHANVLGLEVVTPKGEILNLGYDPMPHLKDNTGYDLKHLFIGGEGTLGVVTKVALRCQPLPISRGAIWLTCASLMDVVQILALARTKQLSEILAAFEFMDGEVLELVRNSHPSIRFPVDISSSTDSASSKEQYSILIETHGCNYSHDMEKLESFLECLFEEGLVTDGAMAQNLGQIEDFWNVRELCNPASAATGKSTTWAGIHHSQMQSGITLRTAKLCCVPRIFHLTDIEIRLCLQI